MEKYRDELDNLILFRKVFLNTKQRFDFSSDYSEKIYIGYTVTYVMIRMALYRRSKEIYLLGMEHNLSIGLDENDNVITRQGIKSHLDIFWNYSMWGVSDIKRVTQAYMDAKKYADKIKIYNATQGGKLEIFKRVNFDKVF